MMRPVAFALALAALASPAVHAQCPPCVKNRDSLEAFPLGEPARLPDGFIVYRLRDLYGLRRTPTKRYEPAVVPGTEGDYPYCMEISADGQWVLYLDRNSSNLVVQRLDGTGRAELAVWGARVAGFYRASPYGIEAFYAPDRYRLQAVQIDLSGATARFLENTTRTILDLGWGERTLDNGWEHSGFAVCRDQILCREDGFNPYESYSGRTGFYTIPDSGRATATPANLHPWLDDPLTSMWGCGHTMSHDGAFCIANTSLIGTACDNSAVGPSCLHEDGSVGGSACIPNRRAVAVNESDTQHYDHKGFCVFPFFRDSDPAVVIHDIFDRHAHSINWAPPRYRRGEWDEVDFSAWNFSNDPRYLVGALRGSRLLTPPYNFAPGLWVIDWITNTWTCVTPDTLTTALDDPALFLSEISSAPPGLSRSPAPRQAPQPSLLPPLRAGLRQNAPLPASRLYCLIGRRVSHMRSPCSAVLVAVPPDR